MLLKPKNMTRYLEFLLFATSMLVLTPAFAVTPRDLDVKAAQLKELSSRTSEISSTHGTYVVVRDVVVAPFQAGIKKWYTDASQWTSSWETLIRALNGQTLANVGQIDASKAEMLEQITGLNSLRDRLDALRNQGIQAQLAIANVRRYNTNYIKGYKEQISAFNKQVDNLQDQTSKSLVYFSADSASKMEELANKLELLMNTKAAALALSYPELEQALKEVEGSLKTIKLVDRTVNLVSIKSLELRKDLLDGRVYRAKSGLIAFKEFAAANQTRIFAEPSVPEPIRANGINQIQKIVTDLDAEFTNQLVFSPANKRFAGWYDRQMMGRFDGMVKPCIAAIPPKNLDCLLLKSISGFTSAQLQDMTDGQLEYLEQTLIRVREGPVHTSSQSRGVSK